MVSNGVRLHYLEHGVGPTTLVVVPGITSPAATWEFVAEELGRTYRVYTLDNRGRGLSDRPASGYRLEDYAADLASVLKALKLDHPIILGHSMGARIAAAFAARYRTVPTPLIVVDPPLSGPGRAPYPVPLDVYLDAIRDARAGATAEAMRRFNPTWSDQQLQARADWLGTCDESAVTESHRGFHEEDFFTFWPLVRAPAILVYGEKSQVVPASAIPELASRNPSAELAVVPQAGHMIPWDNLPGFIAIVRRFVDGGAVSGAMVGRPVEFHAVLKAADLGIGEATRVVVGARQICLVRLEDGVYAIDDVCTHADASLAQGYVDGAQIECPLHGATFDIKTGKVTKPPALVDLRTYSVRVDGDTILVGLPAA